MTMLNATEKLLKKNSVSSAVEQQKLCEIFLVYESQCAAHCRSSEMKTLIINIITAGIIFALGAPISLSTFAMDIWSGTSAAIANIRNMISHSDQRGNRHGCSRNRLFSFSSTPNISTRFTKNARGGS
jgi:hypothetical protein